MLALLLIGCERGEERPPAAPSAPTVAATPAAPTGAGATVDCTALGSAWAAGVAVERAGGGYDVAGCRAAATARAELVEPAERDPERHECARCNDGSPFGFRLQLAPAPSRTWVIFLEGGGFCDDQALPCTTRSSTVTTSPPGADGELVEFPAAGLFRRDPRSNHAFHNAHFVFAHYCSSDAWTGTAETRRPVSADAGGWYFAGRHNVRALLETLIERYGLDDADPETRVLLAGSSAGGAGVEANAALVTELLPAVAAGGRLKLVNDGGTLVAFDDAGYRPGRAAEPLDDLLRDAYELWQSDLLPACEAAQRGAGRHPGRCFLSRISRPFILDAPPGGLGLPLLVQFAALDSFFLGLHRINPGDPADADALARWRTAAREAVEDAPWLFSGGSRPYHALLLSDEGWALGPDGDSFGEVVTRFWEFGQPERVVFGSE